MAAVKGDVRRLYLRVLPLVLGRAQVGGNRGHTCCKAPYQDTRAVPMRCRRLRLGEDRRAVRCMRRQELAVAAVGAGLLDRLESAPHTEAGDAVGLRTSEAADPGRAGRGCSFWAACLAESQWKEEAWNRTRSVGSTVLPSPVGRSGEGGADGRRGGGTHAQQGRWGGDTFGVGQNY